MRRDDVRARFLPRVSSDMVRRLPYKPVAPDVSDLPSRAGFKAFEFDVVSPFAELFVLVVLTHLQVVAPTCRTYGAGTTSVKHACVVTHASTSWSK